MQRRKSRFPTLHKRSSAIFTHSVTRPEMTRSPTQEEKYRIIEGAIRQLAAKGLIYDTGRRRWSERTQSYQVVWAAVPAKHQQS
jgi:hypothetical protein